MFDLILAGWFKEQYLGEVGVCWGKVVVMGAGASSCFRWDGMANS